MLKLLVVDDDLIFRIGLRKVCQNEGDLQVVAEAGIGSEALQLLSDTFANVDVVILDLAIQGKTSNSYPRQAGSPKFFNQSDDLTKLTSTPGLLFCQKLKSNFPQVPVLLLTSESNTSLLLAAQRLGIEGYCPKGTPTPKLINAIRLVGQKQIYWPSFPPSNPTFATLETQSARKLGADSSISDGSNDVTNKDMGEPASSTWKSRTFLLGMRQIETSLAELYKQLQNPVLSPLDRAFLQGRRRELLAAQWLLKQWFGKTPENSTQSFQPPEPTDQLGWCGTLPEQEHSKSNLKATNTDSDILLPEIFESTFSKLNSTLFNLSEIPLEIDILQSHKKRELLSIILRQIEVLTNELHLGDISLTQIQQKRNDILQDLWQLVIKEFFGKYYTVLLRNSVVEVVPMLLADASVVQTEIFDKIPYVENLFAYFVFKNTLKIDPKDRAIGRFTNRDSYNVDLGEPASKTYGFPDIKSSDLNLGEPTPTALLQTEFLLHNLTIQMANAVIQPLLNHFSESEEIKYEFFDRRWLSNRAILKFRNNLSWKYRVEKYITEPTAIFESRYWLFILDQRGIRKVAIYAPRTEELAQLSGIPLVVTYFLESRDAIAPRLRSAVSFLGSGVVYLLTQVIGRGLGLIGRGILQGIGNSWAEGKLGKKSSRRD